MTERPAQPFRPWLLPPKGTPFFPDPREMSEQDGLIAVGGSLEPAWLQLAYREGLFPWFEADQPILWWSPEPRTVLRASNLHVSRSLQRELTRGRFELRSDTDFRGVMVGCAHRAEGTWLTSVMQGAYAQLHRLGHAHSIEVWMDGELAGGLYGVHVGAVFAAESMFHRRTNASKLALVAAVRTLARAGIELIDVQFLTPHLESLGAEEIPRGAYLSELKSLREVPRDWPSGPLDWR